jgi:hypothetical protein
VLKNWIDTKFLTDFFHVDPITPVVANGSTTAENLALACVSCSLKKTVRPSVPDPETLAIVPIFHPCQQVSVDRKSGQGLRFKPARE